MPKRKTWSRRNVPVRIRRSASPGAGASAGIGAGTEQLERRLLLAAVDVLTQHNDTSRTGDNLSETVLNTSNVNVNTFGRLYSRPVDDQIYSQPLYATGVTIPGKGTHNVVYVATVSDTLYCFDADDPTVTTPYWQDSLSSTAFGAAAGARPLFHTDVGQNCGTYTDFSGNIGIVGTPVIDKASNTIYLVARTLEGANFVQRLHALDLSTGAEKLSGPTVIQGSVTGTGAGAAGGTVAFNPKTENQRDGLALSNGQVIIGWASHCDTGPYHGWVMAYNASNVSQQKWVFNTTPNGSQGGIWMSGAAPTVDSAGNIYFTCGNGDVSTSTSNFGEGVMKLSPTGQLLDYFIPNNWQNLNNIDADFGSSGLLNIPGTTNMVNGDKEGRLFVTNQTNLGHLNTPDQVVQEFQVTPSVNNDHIHGSPVYYKDSTGKQWVYVWGMSDKLKQFQWSNGQIASTTPAFTSNVTIAATPSQPGGLLDVSSNGATAGTGIVWAMSTLGPSANQQVQPGIIRAFNASNVSTELWNSQQNATRDDFGNLAKFNYATIDNGHVYTPTFSNQLVVYGLLAGVPAAPATVTATPVSNKVEIDLSWAAVTGAADYVIERSAGAGTYSPLAIVPAGTTTYADTTVTAGGNYTYRVRARNSVGDSAPTSASAIASFQQLLLARWKFDDQTTGSGGNAADSSGNANTGTVGTGASWTTNGKINDALSFNGTTNAYVTIPNSASLNPTGQISITAWVNATDWNGNRRILQKGAADNQYRLLAEGGVLKFDLTGVGTVTAPLPTTGVWHSVAGTYDGTTLNLYVDGAQVATVAATTPGNLASTTDPLNIGTKSTAATTAGDYFSGLLDDVRLYNYALPASDVSTLFTNGIPPAPTSLTLLPTSPSMVTVKWTDNSGNESGFVLQRKTGAAGTYATIATLAANTVAAPSTVTYIDTGLSASTTYFYRVLAYNVVDSSAYTPEQQTTTLAPAINQLVARWAFDDGNPTTATDSSGYNNPGTLAGSPAYSTDTPDASARSLSFNGTTQWVQVPDSFYLEPTGTISLAAWVKAGNWTGTRGIIAKGDREGAYYLIADSGVLKFNLSGQGTLTAPLPSTGVWHSVVGTYDGATMSLYVDGLLVSSMAATGALLTSSDPLFVGGTAASAATGQAFAGLIDDARVYNFAITPRDVSAIYGNVASWQLSEGTGATTADASPNNNTGTLVNSPTWAGGWIGSGLTFDGASNPYVQFNNNQVLNPTAGLTLAAWVNPTDWNGTPTLIQKGATTVQYRLWVNNGLLQADVGGVGSVTAPLPLANAWHQITATYNGSALKLYVDGQLTSTVAATGTMNTTPDNVTVGSPGPGAPAGTMFHGTLDDVRVYSRGLTAGEVQALATETGTAPPAIALTTLTDGSTAAAQTQRSEVRQLTVSFNQPVAVGAGAFTLARLNTGGSGANDNSSPTDLSAALAWSNPSGDGRTWVVTFGTANAAADATGSLTDGIYTLAVHASAVTANGATLAGGDQTTTFHRLFGDTDGNKTVNAGDYQKFKAAFGTFAGNAAYNLDLDFDNNGNISAADYNQFKNRFGKIFSY